MNKDAEFALARMGQEIKEKEAAVAEAIDQERQRCLGVLAPLLKAKFPDDISCREFSDAWSAIARGTDAAGFAIKAKKRRGDNEMNMAFIENFPTREDLRKGGAGMVYSLDGQIKKRNPKTFEYEIIQEGRDSKPKNMRPLTLLESATIKEDRGLALSDAEELALDGARRRVN